MAEGIGLCEIDVRKEHCSQQKQGFVVPDLNETALVISSKKFLQPAKNDYDSIAGLWLALSLFPPQTVRFLHPLCTAFWGGGSQG